MQFLSTKSVLIATFLPLFLAGCSTTNNVVDACCYAPKKEVVTIQQPATYCPPTQVIRVQPVEVVRYRNSCQNCGSGW
jgi:PBP1b-binding outer membrane lipoprotein LpoB